MRIDKIRIYDLRIPFHHDVSHRLFNRNQTESVVVVFQDEKGNKGFGEGTPRDYVTGEKLDECLKYSEEISNILVGQEFNCFNDLETLLSISAENTPNKNYPAAKCAIETALLDIWSRHENMPLWRLFSDDSVAESVQYSGVIPYIENENRLLRLIETVKKLDLRSLKVKIVEHDSGLSHLKLIRKKLGYGIGIRVDANAAFNSTDALYFIEKTKPLNLSAIEQPVRKHDLQGLKKVSDLSDIPVIADESMYTQKGPYYLIDNDICHGLNIRLSSCGGIQSALKLYKQAYAKQMTIVIGAHVGETAILSFAGRHFAAICSEFDYLEGSYSKYVLEEDLVPENITFGLEGRLSIPHSPGLGIDIDEKSIKFWSTLYASIGS
jgi:muconate cycloisomerase